MELAMKIIEKHPSKIFGKVFLSADNEKVDYRYEGLLKIDHHLFFYNNLRIEYNKAGEAPCAGDYWVDLFWNI